MGRSSVNVIIKPTRACNFRCEYCHDLEEARESMSFAVLARSIERILAAGEEKSYRFIWHGGEPLLMGREFFVKAVALQHEFRYARQEISNNLQTNGALLDDRFADLFRDLAFTIGVSLDGPEYLHDVQRPDCGGKPTFRKVIKALERLEARGIPFGVLTVLTSRTVRTPPKELLAFYLKNKIADVCFLPVRSDCRLNGESLDFATGSTYLKNLFDEWLLIDDSGLHIREFRNWILLAMGLPGTLCSSSGSCIGSSYSIELDGSVYHCDKFVQDEDFRYGTVQSIDFHDLGRSDRFRKLCSWDSSLPEHCLDCPWKTHCAGGCSHDRYLRKLRKETLEPCLLRDILAHVRHRIKDHPGVKKFLGDRTLVGEPPPLTSGICNGTIPLGR